MRQPGVAQRVVRAGLHVDEIPPRSSVGAGYGRENARRLEYIVWRVSAMAPSFIRAPCISTSEVEFPCICTNTSKLRTDDGDRLLAIDGVLLPKPADRRPLPRRLAEQNCRGSQVIIRQFVYLDALARERHFRRAADACSISQPTLSAAIAQLETELGVMIVKRDRRFIGLTPEGELVLSHARRILADAQSMKDSLSELRSGLRGTLRLGAIPTALPLVAHITAPFSRRYPAVKLTVLSLTSQEIQSRIDNFELDVGLTYLDNEPLSAVVPKPVYHESYVALFREDDPAARAREIAWAEIATRDLCLLTPDMQNRRIIDGIFRSVGAAPSPSIETNSIFNLCTHAAIPGIVSIVSRQLLDFFGLPSGVRAARLVEPTATRTIGLIMADRDPAPPLARALYAMTDFLTDQANGGPSNEIV